MRVFFAITLPKSCQASILEFIEKIRYKPALNKIRWTKAENLHLTLRFLGKVEDQQLPELIEHVDTTLHENPTLPFVIKSNELIPFPKHKSRALSLGVKQHKNLTALHECITQTTEALGFEREKRDFTPHITLGRFKHPSSKTWPDLQPLHLEIEVGKVVLFKSEPTPEGSLYTVIHTFLDPHAFAV